jgi:hypothetical protein
MSCHDSQLFAPLGDIFVGTRLTIASVVQSSDEPPVPVDLTGKVVRFCIASQKQSEPPLIALTSEGDEITITDAAAGEFVVEVPATAMEELIPNVTYLVECDYYDATDADTVELLFWSQFTARRKINPAPPAS